MLQRIFGLIAGFKSYVQPDIELRLGERTSLDVKPTVNAARVLQAGLKFYF